MSRRDFVRLGWATVIGTGAGTWRPSFAESNALRHPVVPEQRHHEAKTESKVEGRAADFTLRIAPTMVELAPQAVISTVASNDKVRGRCCGCGRGSR